MLQRLVASRYKINFCLLVARCTFNSSQSTFFVRKKNHYCQTTLIKPNYRTTRRFLHEDKVITGPLTEAVYEQLCDATLESLCEYFEELVEQCPHLADADINLGDGVLTVQLGGSYGTYVINRQRPNLQVWLSSPTSGPKRYDFVNGQWIYKHDGVSLHEILEKEITPIAKRPVDLSNCAYSKCN